MANLEKAQVAAKAKPKAKAKTAMKKPVAKNKGAAKLTATDQVVNVIKRSKRGADVQALMKKTRVGERSVRNILFRAGKQGKIKRAGRGVYVGA